jgi:RNA polymerase sigma-70 factor (ECF subfamily)
MKTDRDLALWWEAFRKGEPWAFIPFYERFKKPVLGFLGDRVADPETAEDLAQEVFLKAHRFRSGLSGDEVRLDGLSGWIFQIARNTLYDWWRAGKSLRSMVRSLEPGEEPPAPESSGPGGHAERAERRQLFRSWLKVLTPAQRRAVWLWLIRGLSYEQIGRSLGLSGGAVKSLIHRARSRLPQPEICLVARP